MIQITVGCNLQDRRIAAVIGLGSHFRPPVVISCACMEHFQLNKSDQDYDYTTDTLEISD